MRGRRIEDAAPASQIIAAASEAIARNRHEEAESLLRPLAAAGGAAGTSAQRLLGSLLGSLGRIAEARRFLEAAHAADPRHAQTMTDLGNVCRSSGLIAEAESWYRKALALDPAARTPRFNLAVMLRQGAGRGAAVDILEELLVPPAHADALRTLVEWMCEDACGHEARALCERVLRAEPGHRAAHASLRMLMLRCDVTPGDVLRYAEAALAAGYTDAEILLNRALAQQYLGRHAAALASYDEVLAAHPEATLARFHRALALLAAGEFERAWPDYELRLASRELAPPPRRFEPWTGEPLPERTLLVYGEQGIGDEIMFASCIPALLNVCPRVVLACAARLEPLFRRSFPQIRVVSMDALRARTFEWDEQSSDAAMTAIGSLPGHLRRTRTDLAGQRGYLRADPDLVARYRDRLHGISPVPKIGFSWRGGGVQSRRDLRSLDAKEVAELLSIPDVQFVNLQYDSLGSEPEIAKAVEDGRLLHWPEALSDYEHTAALVSALDLTLSVCTAVIHLAGALDREVLIMAPFSAEWRYGVAGEAMPWYPSARIIRQPAPGAWQPVIAEVRSRLREPGA